MDVTLLWVTSRVQPSGSFGTHFALYVRVNVLLSIRNSCPTSKLLKTRICSLPWIRPNLFSSGWKSVRCFVLIAT